MARATVESQSYTYTVVFELDEEAGGYTVTCPALPGLVTEGDTLEEARERAAGAIRCYLEACAKIACPCRWVRPMQKVFADGHFGRRGCPLLHLHRDRALTIIVRLARQTREAQSRLCASARSVSRKKYGWGMCGNTKSNSWSGTQGSLRVVATIAHLR